MFENYFDFIKQQSFLNAELYFELEKIGIDAEKLDELLDAHDELCEKTLQIGKYLDKDKYVNKNTYITKSYEGADRFLKLHIIYQYKNGMALCSSTTDFLHLVPCNLLSDIN